MDYRKKIEELKFERKKCISDARKIMEQADKEKRARRAEEKEQFDKIMERADELKKDMEDYDRMMGDVDDMPEKSVDDVPPMPEKDKEENSAKKEKELRNRAFAKYLKYGRVTNPDEYRALSFSNNAEGGYLVAPQQFKNDLIQFVNDNVFLRGLATVDTLSNVASLGIPSLDTDIDDSDWTTELGTGSEDSSMAFGKRELRPYPFAKRIKVSRDLLTHTAMGVEGKVKERMGYKNSVTEERAFLTGTGAGQPLGLFTASSMGIPTSRDFTCAATTAISADDLRDAYYDLKQQYRTRDSLAWIGSREFANQVALLKDGEGRYMFDVENETLMGKKFCQSEFAPSTFTTGQYVAVLGDMKFYNIVDVDTVEVQRLEELYAENNQVGFISRRFVDGMPVLAEAFVRMKLA